MSSHNEYIRRVVSAVGIVTAAVLITWLLILGINVLLMIFAAAVMAVPISWLADKGHTRLHMPRWLALTLSVLLIIGLLGGLTALAVPALVLQAGELIENIESSLNDIRGFLARLPLGNQLVALTREPIRILQGEEGGYSGAVSRALGIFSNTLYAITWPLLVLLMSIYFSAEPSMYRQGLVRLLPPPHRQRTLDILDRMGHTVRWWLLGQFVSMFILGLFTTLLLWILNIPLAFLLGLLTAFMTFIPILGPIIAGIPVMLVALSASPGRAIFVGIFYLILQNIEGSFITPTVHRRIIAMPPVLIISTQIVLASLIGFVGVLLAMPLVACAMVIVQMVYVEDMVEGGARRRREQGEVE